jgi:hypothetical protein
MHESESGPARLPPKHPTPREANGNRIRDTRPQMRRLILSIQGFDVPLSPRVDHGFPYTSTRLCRSDVLV